MKILIIDDVDYIRKSIQKVLSDNNFTCQTCINGRDAVNKLGDEEFDLIITDIMMPDMDGFEFLDYIRSQDGHLSTMPVIAMSGGSKTIDSETALKIIEEKTNAILKKPFGKNDLLKTIEQVIGSDKYHALTAATASA
jgi:CheY-like chemotaxis protein